MMGDKLIISDLHLCEERLETAELFFKFLKNQAALAKELYILGDFFEVWLGDDAISVFQQQIIDKLAALANSGVKIYFLHGNRDFLLGKKFFAMSHSKFLPDQTTITAGAHKFLLLHGDALCTDDLSYQRYRKVANLKLVRFLFLKLPLYIRLKIALKLRRNDNTLRKIVDVNQHAVLEAFTKNHVNTIIHGHTHRYAIHNYPGNQRRFVLGDWHAKGSFIAIDSTGKVELNRYA